MEGHHPRRRRNEIVDEAEIRSLLKEGKFVTIALCRGEEPYVVTLSYGWDEERERLYFHCANAGDKLDFVAANPRACATLVKDNGYMDGQCDHDYASLVIRGRIRVVTDLDEKKRGLGMMLEHLEKDPAPILARNIKNDADWDSVTILRLDIESVSGKKRV
jgi:hypothetical protein